MHPHVVPVGLATVMSITKDITKLYSLTIIYDP